MHLTALNVHPVKSLRGFAVDSVEVDALGSVGDRRFMVVDPDGKPLTQRSHAAMATVATSLDAVHLALRAPGLSEIRVLRAPDPGARLLQVAVWSSEGLKAEDCGDGPAEWLSGALGSPCRLVRAGTAFVRPVKPMPGRPDDRVGFADAYPFLVTTEGSLADLNLRISASGGPPVPMGRFRPNMVFDSHVPFAEDGWKRIQVGEVVFRVAGPCARCTITTTDQFTGVRGAEPLRTLAAFRRDPEEPSSVNFGQNLVHETRSGVLRVGDPVQILE
jgi:uncharacterized protein YcbX